MTAPIIDTGHYTVTRREGQFYIVKCTCKWQAPGGYYHEQRAQMAGERHIKEQAA